MHISPHLQHSPYPLAYTKHTVRCSVNSELTGRQLSVYTCVMSTPRTALEKAAKNVGGFSELARLLGMSRQAVYKWLETKVPAERCVDVEQVSRVSRRKLRPDVFGPRKREGEHDAALNP